MNVYRVQIGERTFYLVEDRMSAAISRAIDYGITTLGMPAWTEPHSVERLVGELIATGQSAPVTT